MKKLMYVSGTFAVLLLILIAAGHIGADGVILMNAFRRGNEQYQSEDYTGALKSYETGLNINQGDKLLNFNAAQAAYSLVEYEKALEYYDKADDLREKFLNSGNICFRAGDAMEEAEGKIELYGQAMQIYANGILRYPQDVPLKYNYELVKQKLEELLEGQEQEGDGENQESQESGEGEESEETEENQSQQQDDGEEDEPESSGGEGEDGEENSEDEESYSQNEDDGEEGEDENGSAVSEEEIERILQMLEDQEEESLKNNQNQASSGEEEKYGW